MGSHATTIERVYCERYVGFRNALASVTGDPDSARDAVQEGFARALRSARGFRGDGPIEAWLWKICLRAALELRGRSARDVPLGDVDSALVDPGRDPELAEALRQLPERRRLIVFLRYFADLSYAEIAAACDVSEGTVAATLAQARTKLAEHLQEVKG
jgi:RNA polymerase sigma-70 factor (ECF subfamily)